MSTATVIVRAAKNTVQDAFPSLEKSVVQDGVFSRIASGSILPTSFQEVWFITDDSPLPKLAGEISSTLGTVALAALDWEGDLLKLWAFQDGQIVYRYDSNPSYATCTVTSPEQDAPGTLAELFGVPEKSRAVGQLLSRRKGLGFISETDRLRQLLGLLGVSENAEARVQTSQ
jgi:hypothetical protein